MLFTIALLAFVAPLVAGLTLQVSGNPASAGTITVSWTATPTDVPFSLELVNVNNFHDTFAIGNNLNPAAGSAVIALPLIPPGGNYALEAVAISNINSVYASVGPFNIAAASTPSTTATSPGSTFTSLPSVTTTSSFSTISSSGTASSISGSSTSSVRPTTSSAATAPLKINSNIGAFAAVLFSAIAGAAIVAL